MLDIVRLGVTELLRTVPEGMEVYLLGFTPAEERALMSVLEEFGAADAGAKPASSSSSSTSSKTTVGAAAPTQAKSVPTVPDVASSDEQKHANAAAHASVADWFHSCCGARW